MYSYSSTSNIWWNQIAGKLERARNLQVFNLSSSASAELARMAKRTMQLQCTVQDGQIWIADGDASVHLELEVLKGRTPA